MSTRQNLSIHLAERPNPYIVPGQTFSQRTTPAPTASDLKPDQVLVENLYLSLDPAMRGWLNDRRSYVPPVQIGEVMRGGSVARVLASTSPQFKEGDLVTTFGNVWTEVLVLPAAQATPVRLPANARVTDAMGVLGMTGLTAYFGMLEIGQPKKGETVVVSGAAGATGSVAAQIAKIYGARVVGIAGKDDKVKWLTEELGLDVALNYNDPDFKEKFKQATPDYVDVFWDNVGGEQLELALGRANKFARFVECGMISQYNSAEAVGPRNIMNVVSQRVRLQGFIVFDFIERYDEGRKQLAQWLSEGKLQRKETIIKGGLKAAEEGLLQLFKGQNTGKMLVEIKNLEEGAKL
ncbi:NADP-dependent leukotriene B4 12-hydroxydehydrogenase [Coniochaeta ligniaria NRRL 30616]|uniref:Dehydrogenase FUB6 n=1 Tax=Coniochaeta ligniaria NRRL 30616 TaxID=1408157 RepID=A0A1J7IZX6_9PEZI|nr:NADP-dependent leukotriene B4 12-hydroxydehydrogenase [Coniochaeta ligniaria NRRL 30616]